MVSYNELSEQCIALKAQRNQIRKSVSELEVDLESEIKHHQDCQSSLDILRLVAQACQLKLEERISSVVTSALHSVFPEPYDLKLVFELKRNSMEASIKLCRDGLEIDPMTEAGGGVVDVASFALRVSMWSMQRPRSRNTLILDEPFKFVSKDLQPRVSQMLKEISERLHLQMIIVTHEKSLEECADKILNVTIKDGRSKLS